MKVAVIGAGYWGKKHVDEYTHLEHDVVVFDAIKENSIFCESNYGAKIAENLEEIFNNNEIKCVSICTNNETHKQIALDALHSGKHILVEKPITVNPNDADEIINLANKKNLQLLVGHIFRFNNVITKIKNIIREQQLGTIYSVSLNWSELYPVLSKKNVIIDQGVHPVDIIQNIFENNPSQINCIGRGFRTKNYEHAIINYFIQDNFTNSKVLINIELSWINPLRSRKMIIIGSKKTASIDCVLQKIQIMNNQSKLVEDVNVIPNNTIQDELEYFLNCCNQSKNIQAPYPTGVIGKQIVEILEKAQNVLQQNG